jgi:peptidoglycan/LPS O-acetylase OafA/YrhL
VDVFFVLSGFLITSVLLQEWSKRETINLRNFYARRALRLLPGLAVLLFCLAVYSYNMPYFPAAAVEIRREIVFTFFYVTNWALAFGAMPALGLLGHAWTLAIEEQFYLLWPMLLLSMLRAGFSRRAVAWATAAGILASALLRLWMWERGATADRLFFGFDTRCDTLLFGCLAGIYATFPDRRTPMA